MKKEDKLNQISTDGFTANYAWIESSNGIQCAWCGVSIYSIGNKELHIQYHSDVDKRLKNDKK